MQIKSERATVMKRINFFEKTVGARTVYTLAGVSFCLAVIAVGVLYSKTAGKVQNMTSQPSTTYQVNINKQDEIDPRYSGNVPESTAAASTAETTAVEFTGSEIEEEEIIESAVAATTVAITEKQELMLPCDGEIIKEYSPKVPLYCETMEDWRTHSGVDFAVADDGEVLSVGKGKVSKVLVDSSYGYIVEVDYGEFTARYCGLEQGTTVGINQLLNKGDSIGKVGEVPCEKKSERHLHLEIIRNGDYADPMKVLK